MTRQLLDPPLATPAGRVVILGVVLVVLLSLAQIYLEADPIVILLAAASALVVAALLAGRPYDFGSWFVAFAFFQLFGFAWIYKSLLLIPLDAGLLKPVPSMVWGFLLVLGAGGAAAASKLRQKPSYVLHRYYGEPARWVALGWLLFALGELSLYASFFVNRNSGSFFGGFAPLVGFTTTGLVLLANSAVGKGRIIDFRVTAVLVLAVVDGLLFNSKSSTVFQCAAVVLAVMLGPVSRFRKVVLLVAAVAVLVFADRVMFPAIHAMRGTRLRSASTPLEERMTIIRDTFTGVGNKWEDTASYEGNIFLEKHQFIPGSSLFIRRFGALGNLDITLKYGDPGSSHITPAAFVRSVLSKVVPGPLSPGKDYYHSQADKLWIQMDQRMEGGISNATMGSFPSARLIFGEWEGFVLTIGVWLVMLWVWRCFYGSDVRNPLVQSLLVTVAFTVLDLDIEGLAINLVRLAWQNIAILALAGWLVGRVSSSEGAPPATHWRRNGVVPKPQAFGRD